MLAVRESPGVDWGTQGEGSPGEGLGGGQWKLVLVTEIKAGDGLTFGQELPRVSQVQAYE